VRRDVCVILPLLVMASPCNRVPATTPSPTAVGEQPTASELPDGIAGFVAGPLTVEGGVAQRLYARGASRISVTVARFPMTGVQYREWVKTSTEGYVQAPLDVAPGDGNGFYQCDEGPRPSCDLLIQFRSGVHIEIRGAGTSSRQDVDAIARGLPLRALSTR
jgi:hypothetical protein